MSDADSLAEKIARLIESERGGEGVPSSIQASLDGINARLSRLEAAAHAPAATSRPSAEHPSQEKFAVLEAVADQIFNGIKDEKACTFEPNGRPCDHCSMCSSRGF